jgi:hypothetical protein
MTHFGNLPDYQEQGQGQGQGQGAQENEDPLYYRDANSVDSVDSVDSDYCEHRQHPCAPLTKAVAARLYFDINDPLRYCVKLGEISEGEYERWKIVRQPLPTVAKKRSTPTLDFGAGYNSDSDTDDDGITRHPIMIYGSGYLTQFPHGHTQHDGAWVIDPWFPNPDPTPNKQYADIATTSRFMMSQFVMLEEDGKKTLSKLKPAFVMKLIWERFITNNEITKCEHLQDFWQNNVLEIYEALQELVATHARVCSRPGSEWIRSLIPEIPPLPKYHSTPIETLENTFETIGRMSRCMAEEFNTPSVSDYIGEFMKAFYIEMLFIDLVEEYEEEKISEVAKKSVMTNLTTSKEHDFIMECDNQSEMPWFCGDD